MLKAWLLIACVGFAAAGCNKHDHVIDQRFDSIRERYGGPLYEPNPSQYPQLAPNRELLNLAAWAIEHHQTVNPRYEIFLHGFFHDSKRGVIYIGFNGARPSTGEIEKRYFRPDFYLVYVYDSSEKLFRGYYGAWP